ncbi:hypothetical protein J6590_034364 [Homalodisca vitripennis]|nr:hypothetical protein J6590_034364 [Homalodisca vitripennis]
MRQFPHVQSTRDSFQSAIDVFCELYLPPQDVDGVLRTQNDWEVGDQGSELDTLFGQHAHFHHKTRNVSLDVGAEFVHGQVGNAVYELAAPYNFLVSYSPLLREGFLYVNSLGEVFDNEDVKELIDKAYSILDDDEMESFNGSVGDFFFPRFQKLVSSKDVDPWLGEAVELLVELEESVSDGADDLYDMGTGGYLEYETTGGDQSLKWRFGGYSALFDIISNKIPDPEQELPVRNKTLFGKQVIRIEQLDGDVEVTCVDGSRYLADHVIVTLPLGVLKQHAAEMFHPPLPPEKTAAIDALGSGCVGKVFLQFSSRWWPSEIHTIVPLFSKKDLEEFKNKSTHGYWTSYTSGFYPVLEDERMLCAWFAGESCRAMEALSEDEIIGGLMELLERLMKDIYVPRPEAVLRSQWASDPFTLGSYSYRTVANDQENVTNADLARPIFDKNGKPVVLFAGEATHPSQWATVHGAMATGRREANTVINYLGDCAQSVDVAS